MLHSTKRDAKFCVFGVTQYTGTGYRPTGWGAGWQKTPWGFLADKLTLSQQCYCSKSNQQHPGLRKAERHHRVEEGDLLSPLSLREMCGALSPVLGSKVKWRQGETEASPVKGHEAD